MSRYLRIFSRVLTVGGPLTLTTLYLYSKKKFDDANTRFKNAIDFTKDKMSGIFDNLFSSDEFENIMERVVKSTLVHNEENQFPFDEIESLDDSELRNRLREFMAESIEMQRKYKTKIMNLNSQIREMQREIENLNNLKNRPSNRRKSLVEQYSDILESLYDTDVSSINKDALPRIVVVGDQSSGKTSVLEYIAKAHIFPRGSGEMMTRSPVMVTLSHGPKHVASFKNGTKEYKIDNEKDLKELRDEIERRMKNIVQKEKTVSSEVVSINMTGPGLPRMVLVDLPGIINTVTTDLASDTKESIISLAKSYMSNPNSIILCVQDGSVDAERSLVTELVNLIDPSGSRTICVLTKLDVAERNNVKMERIQRLMSGKLFPMKALEYYAVISGTDNSESSISEIAAYEQEYFKKSAFFKDGIIKPRQATSQNLISAVSERFWGMVRSSVEREIDSFRSKLFALEAEWKNNFPNIRELNRDELFEKARGDILDDVIHFSSTTAKQWETLLSQGIWQTVIPFAFREIYLANALTSSKIGFQTQVDILMEKWLKNKLTDECVQIAKNTMLKQLREFFERKHPHYDENNFKALFQQIHEEILEQCAKEFNWSSNNYNNLKIIQSTALADGTVSNKSEWDQACSFMENIVQENNNEIFSTLSNVLGPSTSSQWLYWQSLTPEQLINQKIASELEKMAPHRPIESNHLTQNEISTVLQNLQNAGVITKPENVNIIWEYIFLNRFYKDTIQGIHECRNLYRSNDFSKHKLGCNDVLLFFKIHKLVQQTVIFLRQQITPHESRRLECVVKHCLENISIDDEKKRELFKGKQVELAEEIKKISQVKSDLEKFNERLLRESNYIFD